MTQINDYLFVGPIDHDIETDIVISMIPGSSSFYNFPIYDEPWKQLIGPASRAHKVITKAKIENKTVYVCCRQGKSRSVMTCAWHLLWSGYSLSQIKEIFLKSKISFEDANFGFVSEFVRYANSEKFTNFTMKKCLLST